MKTPEELVTMTNQVLRKEAATLKVKDYWNLDKAKLIDAIMIAQGIIQDEILHPETEKEEEIYTDRHGKLLILNESAYFKVGNNWIKGIVTKFKEIEKEQYVCALLEGSEKTKMFHTNDCEIIKEGIKKPKINQEILKQINIPAVVIVGESNQSINNPLIKKQMETPESVPDKKEKKVKEPKVLKEKKIKEPKLSKEKKMIKFKIGEGIFESEVLKDFKHKGVQYYKVNIGGEKNKDINIKNVII